MADGHGAEMRLVNGSAGDPALWIDHPGRDDAFLFDAGDNALPLKRLADLRGVFVTHCHIDHFVGLDRILRANLDRDKTLVVYGPPGLIPRVHQRLSAYEHQWFPFQKLVLELVEVHPDSLVSATLPFLERLPAPELRSAPRQGPVVYEDQQFVVEAAAADHSAPCLAYALVERGGRRIAYVTDTRWSPMARPGLLALARGAERLYCDCSYAERDRKAAEKYGHMTARDAAEFATLAGAKELVLMHFSGRYAGRYEPLLDEARAAFPAARAEL